MRSQIEKEVGKINQFVEMLYDISKYVPKNVGRKIGRWRTRNSDQILNDCYINGGCTDSALTFIGEAKSRGIEATYVETVNEKYFKNPILKIFPFLIYLTNIEGHIFVDISVDGKVIPYNPLNGFTKKEGKVYLWTSETPKRKYIEIARGSDFSHLYTEDSDTRIELKTTNQIRKLINEINKEQFISLE